MPKPCHVRHPDFAAGCRPCWLARHDARYMRLWGVPGDPEPVPPGSEFGPADRPDVPAGLGDEIEALIRSVGLDRLAELYERVTGRPCGCGGRRAMLNRLPAVLPAVRRLLGGG